MNRRLAWGAAEHVLERSQWVPRSVEEVFPFFEDPHNLARITPRWLRFEVTSMVPDQIRPGTIITYRLRWLGIPYSWKTLIEEWEPGERFVDRMLNGPYVLWHHTHTFEPCSGGVLLRDRVRYQVPFGPFGELLHALLIRRQVESIFKYRQTRIAELLSDARVYERPPAGMEAN